MVTPMSRLTSPRVIFTFSPPTRTRSSLQMPWSVRIAKKIGHNANKTDYVVQRGRHAAPERPLTPVSEPPPIAI